MFSKCSFLFFERFQTHFHVIFVISSFSLQYVNFIIGLDCQKYLSIYYNINALQLILSIGSFYGTVITGYLSPPLCRFII